MARAQAWSSWRIRTDRLWCRRGSASWQLAQDFPAICRLIAGRACSQEVRSPPGKGLWWGLTERTQRKTLFFL